MMEICKQKQAGQGGSLTTEAYLTGNGSHGGQEVAEQRSSSGGQDADELRKMRRAAQKLLEVLKQQNFHISLAESCTGGMMASTLVDLSGASDVFEEGYVTYSNRVKQKLLGVKSETLEQYTVVSSQTAAEMAEGVHDRSGAELTISVTGYAGPDDGEDGTPAGTVYIGTWYAKEVQTRHYQFDGDRNSCRRQAVEAAFAFALERIRQSE